MGPVTRRRQRAPGPRGPRWPAGTRRRTWPPAARGPGSYGPDGGDRLEGGRWVGAGSISDRGVLESLCLACLELEHLGQ